MNFNRKASPSLAKSDGSRTLMLNLGCGSRIHELWVNIDYSPEYALAKQWWLRPFLNSTIPAGIMVHNLRGGIPFCDETVDVVYASHVLEHFDRNDALSFMREVRRVLRPGGICRIVVPDLEWAAKAYINALTALREQGVDKNIGREQLEWATIMLLDQMVRTVPGGEMQKWLRQHRHSAFVRSMGGIILEIADSDQPTDKAKTIKSMIKARLFPNDPALKGELHRWMYDNESLNQLFLEAGFENVLSMSHLESRIPEWKSYCLDNNLDSTPHQPHSIWMEGVK